MNATYDRLLAHRPDEWYEATMIMAIMLILNRAFVLGLFSPGVEVSADLVNHFPNTMN